MDSSAEKDMTLGRSVLRSLFSTLAAHRLQSLALGMAAILASVAMGHAASRKETNQDATALAPYGACGPYGGVFFYRPGTHRCLKTSDFALAERFLAPPTKAESGDSLFADRPFWADAGFVYATPLLFAYTVPFGEKFSTLTIEQAAASTSGAQQTSATDETTNIAGTMKLDEPWTAAPFQGVVPQAAGPGGALQGNKDMIAVGDQLWLQAAFDKGSQKNSSDSNPDLAYGTLNPAQSNVPLSPEGFDFGWNAQSPTDCVYTGLTAASATCDKPWGGSMSGALKHYWAPDLSSTVSGTSLSTGYDPKALEGFGGLTSSDAQEDLSMGGLDIGTQYMYLRLTQSNQIGHVADVIGATPNPAAAPPPKPNPSENPTDSQNEGRIRVQRQF
ncbi:MAG TPA: hypothetical protein VGG12_02050 [Methylovirgula sp.]|jgi:hypothetical protein